MNKQIKSNSIRIIAGSMRGRRLTVLDSAGLRPTTDRVRETLFNWLMHDINGANCLDLFAGSGVLGFECLSRGAEFVQFVEKEVVVSKRISENLTVLLSQGDASRASVTQIDAISFLKKKPTTRFDIVFLDPPFASDLVAQAIDLLVENEWLSDRALVYIEQNSNSAEIIIPDAWTLFRQGKAGQSAYCVYEL